MGKKTVKCFMGVHSVPKNSIFESHGAVFLGGLCRKCGHLAQGEFLYNMWNREEKTETGVVKLTGTNPQLAEDLGSRKYMWDEKYYGKE